ncbi:UNVERIFIED_CONTAM: hypothetical protein FKN15_025409 [Acipenser sinensis]
MDTQELIFPSEDVESDILAPTVSPSLSEELTSHIRRATTALQVPWKDDLNTQYLIGHLQLSHQAHANSWVSNASSPSRSPQPISQQSNGKTATPEADTGSYSPLGLMRRIAFRVCSAEAIAIISALLPSSSHMCKSL